MNTLALGLVFGSLSACRKELNTGWPATIPPAPAPTSVPQPSAPTYGNQVQACNPLQGGNITTCSSLNTAAFQYAAVNGGVGTCGLIITHGVYFIPSAGYNYTIDDAWTFVGQKLNTDERNIEWNSGNSLPNYVSAAITDLQTAVVSGLCGLQ